MLCFKTIFHFAGGAKVDCYSAHANLKNYQEALDSLLGKPSFWITSTNGRLIKVITANVLYCESIDEGNVRDVREDLRYTRF